MAQTLLFLFLCFLGSFGQLSDDQIQQILQSHNTARARFGSPPLVWNQTLAQIASDWASGCSAGFNDKLSSTLGENLAIRVDNTAPVFYPGIVDWLDQEQSWTCSTTETGACAGGDGPCYMWLQVIWKDTTQIGCAFQQCNVRSPVDGFSFWSFLVCDYSSAALIFNKQAPAVSTCSSGNGNSGNGDQGNADPTGNGGNDNNGQGNADSGNGEQGNADPAGNSDNGNNAGNQGNGNGNAGIVPPAGTGSSFSDSDVSNILNLHNSDRARYGSAPLVWNSTIAKIAQDFASQCKWGINPNLKQQCGNNGCGENVAVAAGADPKYTTWSSQESSWICSTTAPGRCQDNKQCGNFQQIVWKDTKQIGCGIAKCSGGSPLSGFNDWNFLVCDYADPGNFNGVPAVTQCPGGNNNKANNGNNAGNNAGNQNGNNAGNQGNAGSGNNNNANNGNNAGNNAGNQNGNNAGNQNGNNGGNIGPAGSGSSFTADEVKQMLNSHNADRARYGSAPLVWNSTIAKIAQDFVSQCKWGSNPNLKAQCGGSFGCGSNTAASAGTKAPVADPKYSQWVSAEKNWQCSTSGPGTCSTGNCGSFTQVVWKGTTQIGCAKQQCTTGYPDPQWKFWSLMVCYYAEPGNFVNRPAVNKCPSGGSLRNADEDTSSSPALSTGALAGVIVGSVVVAVIVLVAILFLVFRSRSRRNSETV